MSAGRSISRRGWGVAAGAALAAGVVFGGPLGAPAMAQGQSASAKATDTIIFRSGRQVPCKIVEETDKTVRALVFIGSSSAEATYEKADILSIQRGVEEEAEEPEAEPARGAAGRERGRAASAGREDAVKVYVVELKGWFGEDISQTPIRDAVRDARRHEADYIVMVMDNDWSLARFGQMGEIKDDQGAFDMLFRAEDMDAIFTKEIPREWENPPTVVFWVKKAMGGAAFLPLICPNIYFASDAKMGGIGNLSKMFEGVGDKVVQEKQYSLRLKHAEGMAITGGYAPEIVRAMARYEDVWSVGFEGGRPVFYNRYAEHPGEVQLTDDGQNENEDTIEQLARGEGNDVLTLDSNLAFKLGVSRGTVDSLEDLLFELGIARRSQVVPGRSRQIMSGWSQGIADAKRQLPRLWRQFGEVQVEEPGGWEQRRNARGRRISIIDQILAVMQRYEEALNVQELEDGPPPADQLRIIKEQIRLEQLQDRR